MTAAEDRTCRIEILHLLSVPGCMEALVCRNSEGHIWLSFKHILSVPLWSLRDAVHIQAEDRLTHSVYVRDKSLAEETSRSKDEIISLEACVAVVDCPYASLAVSSMILCFSLTRVASLVTILLLLSAMHLQFLRLDCVHSLRSKAISTICTDLTQF